jgi:hypothetical protein
MGGGAETKPFLQPKLRRELTTRAAQTFDEYDAAHHQGADMAAASALLSRLSTLAAQGSLDLSSRDIVARALVERGVEAAHATLEEVLSALGDCDVPFGGAAEEPSWQPTRESVVTKHRRDQDESFKAALEEDKAKRSSLARGAARAAAAAVAAEAKAVMEAQVAKAAIVSAAVALGARLRRAREVVEALPSDLGTADVASGGAVQCHFAGVPGSGNNRLTKFIPVTASVGSLHALVDLAIASGGSGDVSLRALAELPGEGGAGIGLPDYYMVAGFPQRPLGDQLATLSDLGLAGRETIRIVLREKD